MVETLKMLHNINIEVYCALLVQHVHTLITSVLVLISQTTMQLWSWSSTCVAVISIHSFSSCFTP